jgi:hypothetical protein
MQNQFLSVDKPQVAIAQSKIADHLALGLIASSLLSAITLWMLGYRLAALLLSR